MVRLFLLALEREELVSVGYREVSIARRLGRMPLDEGSRELIRHALLWTWKDEEMHAIYIRGALFKLGGFRLRAQSWTQQFMGAIGGWAASVQQHLRWREAPVSRLVALVFSVLGVLTGKVPRSVWRELSYRPFRDFAVFNVDAERTASLCWKRLAELATEHNEIETASVDEFRRMQHDEDRHAQVFEILASALDDKDQLVPGENAASLARKFARVGEVFLPRALRHQMTADNPLGRGGPVWVAQGESLDQKLPLFRQLLDDAGLGHEVRRQAQLLGKDLSSLRVVIKASFMLGYASKDLSNVTDPALVEELARYLRRLGCADVAVVESPNLYDRFYQHRSVAEVAGYFGFSSADYRLVDLGQDQVTHAYFRGMAQYTVARAWKEADFRVSFGKLKSHPVELVHLSVANLEGLGCRCDEFLFSERQADRNAAIMTLASDFPPHFGLLDGYEVAADGLMGMMGSPWPRSPKRLYAGVDALAVDLVAARQLGADPKRSAILSAAVHWFGEPDEPIEVRGANTPVAEWKGPLQNGWTALLSFLAYPVFEFGSGRGALFVPEMDEKAFPPSTPVSARLRLGRRVVQRLLGMRHPR